MPTVRRTNPSVDPVRGTVKVLLDFEDRVRERLREAAFARVKLVKETHDDALIVAKDAIVGENTRKYLFVINGQHTLKPGSFLKVTNATDEILAKAGLGAVPLAIGGSGGKEAVTSLGRALIGGLSVGTLLTLFVVPLFYTLIDDLQAWAMSFLGDMARLGKQSPARG